MVERISVRDCTIAHGGRIHSAAVGVWIGNAAHCTVEHCDIHDFTYTGVSVGWVWGYADSRTHHNLILRNHIHDIGYGVLSDMGARLHARRFARHGRRRATTSTTSRATNTAAGASTPTRARPAS